MPEPGLEILGRKPGIWKVLISPKALKSMQNLSHSGSFGSIEEKLRELASGSWSCHLAGTDQQKKKLRVPLVTTRCSLQILLLWQIDVGLDGAAQVESQLVKVWEIGAKTEMSQPIDRVILLQRSYSLEHVRRCRQKPLEDVDKKVIPRLFTDCQNAAVLGVRAQAMDIRTVDREVLEMANRFYMLTEPMLRSVLANDLLAEFPFDFSGDETRIILHFGTSSLILGRSGTGKTTCLVFKLLAKCAAGSTITEARPPRQLLLTRSHELANKLKVYINRLMKSLATSSVEQDEQQERELALTRADDDDDDRCDTIFELQDGSFPLVCTYDRFLELLENTTKHVDQNGFPVTDDDDNTQEKEQSDQSDLSEEGDPLWQPPRKEKISQIVDYQSFTLDYWPRFPSTLVKNLPVELVFAEIMGVIKGALSSRTTLKPLSRREYLELSSRLAPAFTLESEKSRVYDIFEKYQGLKLHRQELDGVDRVVKMIRALRENQRLKTYLGTAFDDIYIDEVQDLRCLDVELLLSIANDGRAFHFAGDTAQTISQDSHFRFQDIKALFYDHFATAASRTNQPELARPRLFTLAKNYRSHQGILGLASLVMAMLWNGFPETVDRLEPEIGQVHGPLPVFFLGCSVRMLASSNTGAADQLKQTLNFGAEQAIIVRDQSTKAKLQAELKDKALILTIFQSKGMEFEDVFLWNFFTDSPCPGGWRCLDTLKTASGKFDAKKHAGMCSELKHFYVAITRARVRLCIIESEEKLANRVVDFLRHDELSPLVEATKSSDADFFKELISLRFISHDSGRWSARGQELLQRSQYEDAAICFRRAKDKRGETCATAFIFEEKGRRLASIDDAEGARVCFRSAVERFMTLDMVAEAVRNLEKIEEFKEAACLWCQYGKPGKAAPLFVKAGMFHEASDHYHQALNYDKAADALRQGGLAEKLVSYVTENREKLSSRSFQRHSRFCILLLKQGKMGLGFLTPAIKLLGSPAEQEQAFIGYEMHDQLADLYRDQGKFKERFLLFIRIGKLGHAMKAISDLKVSDTSDLQTAIRRVQNYYFAGRVVCPGSDDVNIPAQLGSLNSDWIDAQRLLTSKQRKSVFEKIEAIKNRAVKSFLQLHAFLNLRLFDMTSTLDGIPFKAIRAAIEMAESVSSHIESIRDPIILLLTGVMEVDYGTNSFILLPWSPLQQGETNINAGEYPKLANQWLLNGLGCTMLALDIVFRKLWKVEWPVPCAHYLIRGSCRGAKDHSCLHLHKKFKASDCDRKVSLLIKINTTFCSLTATHRRKLMEEDFQEKFSSLRRYWLEKLLRELIFVSSFEHSSQVITGFQSTILSSKQNPRQNKGLFVLAASIEDLLFHRLGRDWPERNDLSSLYEQIQLSQILDYHVQKRFAHSLSYKLYQSKHVEFQQHQIRTLQNLENSIGNPDASVFQGCLRQFTSPLAFADPMQFSSFHSMTTVFEFFTAYLIFRSCRVAVLVPQSWIDIHLPWFGQSLLATEVSNSDLRVYTSSLLELITCFCRLLSSDSLSNPVFRLGVSKYPSRLLHRRNIELLALVIVNFGLSNAEVQGFDEVRERVCQVFSLPYIRGFYLRQNTLPELLVKLVKSYEDYEGKDGIKCVKKSNGPYLAKSKLQELGVQNLSLAELISSSTSRGFSQAQPSRETQEQYSRRVEAVEKIQRFWRSQSPKLRETRAFLKSPEGILYGRFLEICKQRSASKMMRYLLTGDGVELHESIRDMSDTASKLQQRAVDLVMSLPQEQFEHVDEIIWRVSGIVESLKDVASSISMDRLEKLARGTLSEVQGLFRHADSVLGQVGSDLRKATKILKTITGTDKE